MQASRAKCRWVLHDSMIADALTKRHGNSVTMSIVDEDKELAERHQFRQSTSTRQHGCKSSGPVDWEQRYAVAQKQNRVPQNSKPTCRRRVSRASFEDMINKRHEERVEGIARLDVSRSRLLKQEACQF